MKELCQYYRMQLRDIPVESAKKLNAKCLLGRIAMIFIIS
jgi:hypothetical protein